jgi:hypothetical protein
MANHPHSHALPNSRTVVEYPENTPSGLFFGAPEYSTKILPKIILDFAALLLHTRAQCSGKYPKYFNCQVCRVC